MENNALIKLIQSTCSFNNLCFSLIFFCTCTVKGGLSHKFIQRPETALVTNQIKNTLVAGINQI